MPACGSTRRLFWIAALGTAACAHPAPTPAPSALGFTPPAWPLVDEALPLTAPHAMVTSIHPLASEVGVQILQEGGNAVDAAAAVGLALTVVHPAAGNIGGGGFLVIRTADGTVQTLDYRETAPSGATRTMYQDSAGNVTDASTIGYLAVGVPGSVAGLAAAQRRFGKLPWATVVAPAVRLARDGVVLTPSEARALDYATRRLAQFPASARTFLSPAGTAPEAGTVFRQPDLARTLQAIADSGPQVFYQGWIADLIVAEMQRGAGLITKADLAGYRPIWREPVAVEYRGYTIYSMAPSSSGGVTMGEILNIMEGFHPFPPFGSAEQVHLMAEAMRRGFTDRNHFLGDPAFVDMPVHMLLSKDYAADQRRSIDPRHATRSDALTPGIAEGDHTTHYSVVDADGNAVAVTTTLNSGFGSGVTVAGAGFLLNNEMDDFTGAPGVPNLYGLVQGEANSVAPGKRMLSSMSPTIVVDPAGQLLLVLGTPGGSTIISTVLQVISNVVDHGMTLPQAMGAPRIHHQGLPDVISYEHGGLRPEVLAQLERMGHHLRESRGYSGEIAAIMRVPGGWMGVADPRSNGGSAGY